MKRTMLFFLRRMCASTVVIFGLFLGNSNAWADCLQQVSPEPLHVLFWSPEEQRCGYRHMEKIWAYTRTAAKGDIPSTLAAGTPLQIKNVDAFMRDSHIYGLLVLHDGEAVLEQYRDGLTPQDRWTSFSMAKSLTSILAGCAVQDGAIQSLDDPVSKYIPELRKGGYKGVTVRQVLTMTSGVAWNENYQDSDSDVAQLADLGKLSKKDFLAYMASRPRAAKPGTVFNYSTGEACVIGYLVREATGKKLADYLSEKIWRPMSMEQDAVWMTDKEGNEISGCCFSASLRDYGRLGMFMLSNGTIQGRAVLPETWVRASTKASKPSLAARSPYGYQWWIQNDGTYQASGIFGQMLYIDPGKKLVVVMLSARPEATSSSADWTARSQFLQAIEQALAGK